MSEKTTTHIKMARASEKELSELQEFFEQLDELSENGDMKETAKFLIENYHLTNGWRRVIFGYKVMFANACDASSDVLEFKPEIKNAQERIEQLEKELEKTQKACFDLLA